MNAGKPPLPRVYLLDVEGTTSPISLVYEQLFPYARKHLGTFVKQGAGSPEIQADLELLIKENRAEPDPNTPVMSTLEPEQATAYLLWLMDRDRKSTALKSLQGQVWKAGFEAGELIGTVFSDVPDALRRWSGNATVAIYSSGSVEAQLLLFRHSTAGDLTPLITSHFDTRIGAKTSPESYQTIARACGVDTSEVLFISDLLRELDPAREAGCWTRLSMREGNQPVEDTRGHLVVTSFADID
jgi:enolase-phosphatase E1